MKSAKSIIPQAWKDEEYPVKVLYDNDGYSVIWGKYHGQKSLGVRWSQGHNKRGYPGQGKYPTWYVEPEFLILPILNKLLDMAIQENRKDKIELIVYAIKEFSEE